MTQPLNMVRVARVRSKKTNNKKIHHHDLSPHSINGQLVLHYSARLVSFQMAGKQLPGAIYLPRGQSAVFVNAFYARQAAKGTGWDQ